MEMQTSKQLISSHLKGYPIKDYFVGLDIGTGSTGWAVTNKSYELLNSDLIKCGAVVCLMKVNQL